MSEVPQPPPPPPPPPQGVNMPKKIDPRLRSIKAPPPNTYFDSADFEVRKQRQNPTNPFPQR